MFSRKEDGSGVKGGKIYSIYQNCTIWGYRLYLSDYFADICTDPNENALLQASKENVFCFCKDLPKKKKLSFTWKCLHVPKICNLHASVKDSPEERLLDVLSGTLY